MTSPFSYYNPASPFNFDQPPVTPLVPVSNNYDHEPSDTNTQFNDDEGPDSPVEIEKHQNRASNNDNTSSNSESSSQSSDESSSNNDSESEEEDGTISRQPEVETSHASRGKSSTPIKFVVTKNDEKFYPRSEYEKPPLFQVDESEYGQYANGLAFQDFEPSDSRYHCYKVIFEDNCAKNSFSLSDEDERIIKYSDIEKKKMISIADILQNEESLFCKSQYSAKISNQNTDGISFSVYNHYADPISHVLLLGLVPKHYVDATKQFIEFGKEAIKNKLREKSADPRDVEKFRLSNTTTDNVEYYGPFFDGQLEIFVFLYYTLETQDLVNYQPPVNSLEFKQFLCFLLDKINFDGTKEFDRNLKCDILRYGRFPRKQSPDKRNKRRSFPEDLEISLPLLCLIKRNYHEILARTHKKYHKHWHSFMQKLALHHYKCPHTYIKIIEKFNSFTDLLDVYERICVKDSFRSVGVSNTDIKDILKQYLESSDVIPEKFNHEINNLLDAFCKHFATYLFENNHYRPLEAETINSYLRKHDIWPKTRVNLIVEPVKRFIGEVKKHLIENVKFLALLHDKSFGQFKIPTVNKLCSCVHRILTNAFSFDFLKSAENSDINWKQLEESVTDFRLSNFRNVHPVFAEKQCNTRESPIKNNIVKEITSEKSKHLEQTRKIIQSDMSSSKQSSSVVSSFMKTCKRRKRRRKSKSYPQFINHFHGPTKFIFK
ncbi:uncharacterized protein LOC112538655 [Tetranychus urticae]|uniref:uncharacterized protein LOC112538655 n=1 Tax=Tetranychus urticae TaxID=32264 RepID=UPI000D6584B0|nr:uncharacterized protein LOC112538655 [Tetranychus urticae]